MLPKVTDWLRSPINSGWVNFDGHPDGSAMDLGFFIGETPNQNIYPSCNSYVFVEEWDSDGGNIIVLGASYDDNYDLWYANMHMEERSPYNVGDIIWLGNSMGRMGNSGKSNGNHVHLRASLVPKGTNFNWSDFRAFEINPYDYFYAYSDQYVRGMKDKPSEPFIKESLSVPNTNHEDVTKILALTGGDVSVYGYDSGVKVGEVSPSYYEGKLTYPILEVKGNGDRIIETSAYGKVRVPNGVGEVYKARGVQLRGEDVTVYGYDSGVNLGVINPPLDYPVEDISLNGDIVIHTRDYGLVRINNKEVYNIYG